VTTRKTCDVCSLARIKMVGGEPVSDVSRYTLRREANQRMVDGARLQRKQQGAGGIDLCGECWDRICKPNTNPRKANRRKLETPEAGSH
jgi:hypothetical protein